MKIRQYIKRVATLALMVALLAPLQEAWGQAVTGDKYSSVVDYSQISISNDIFTNKVSDPSRIFDDNTNNYATISSGETGTITVNLDGGNVADRIILDFYQYRRNYYTPRTISVLNDESIEIGSASSIGDNTSCTIDLNPSSGSTITLKITAEYGWGANDTRITGITFQAKPSIQHKPAKWHGMRSGGNFVDTFDDDSLYFKYGNQTYIQAAHTIVDTIYVKKGTPVVLALPDRRGGIDDDDATVSNIGSYQRWYNFRTGKTFSLNDADFEDNGERVYDLLTPTTSSTYYRFTNGYVSRPMTTWDDAMPARMTFYYPSDTQFNSISNNYNPGQENNDFYLVACDLSGYTDFSSTNDTPDGNGDETVKDFFVKNDYYEPTLTHRVIYYLVGVESNRTLPSEPEVYEIDFPAYTLPNRSNELVALPMDARSYYAGTNANSLTVSISNNTAGIYLLSGNAENLVNSTSADSIYLDGDDRSIFFRMPNQEGSDKSRYVNNLTSNPTATINVKVAGTGTTVLQFKLNFRNESRLLTQTMVERLDQQQDLKGTTWGSLRARTPDSLSRANILLTELNFDYETSIATGTGSRFYPYPLAWESNSYGFYDGTAGNGFIGGGAKNYYYPEYGSYSLLRSKNGYVETDSNWGWRGGFVPASVPDSLLKNSDGNSSTYHLFVDASDRPGLIARLPFEEDLCSGSVLYVSAWVKTARWNNTSANAAVLFTIMGVDKDGNYTPIYRHQTGQIPATYGRMNEFGLSHPGSDKNEWMQTYFSFVNSNDQTFDHYVLQIDNNSPSTQGGDIYIDDIRVYISRPMAEVKQLEMACTDERTRMYLKIDWDRFCRRAGNVPEGTGTGNLGICFIDTLIFHNTFTGENYEEALDSAVVDLGRSEEDTRHYRLLHYHEKFDTHKNYDEVEEEYRIAAQNGYFFLRQEEAEADARYLIVDFYGDLIPNRAYWVLMVPGISDTSVGEDNEINYEPFSGFYTDRCALVADFKVQGDEIIKINGEIVTPETEFCQGNVYNFTVDLNVPTADGTVTVTDGVYYDWFFGKTNDPLTEYLSANPQYGDVSLHDALRVFRNIYPEAMNLDNVDYGDDVTDDTNTAFTEDMYKLIRSYAEGEIPEGAQNRPLVLRQPSLSITLLSTLRLVICPIPTTVPPGSGITEDEWASVCWGYTYLPLETTDKAPSLHAGFNTIVYPDDNKYDPGLRIGRAQIEEVSTTNSENKALKIDLRGAQSYDDTKQDVTLRRVRNVNGGLDQQYTKIYLIDSDDPAMRAYLDDPDFVGDVSLPIGELVRLEAHDYSAGGTEDTNEMQIKFDLTEQTVDVGDGEFTFNPKEGYYYTFSVYYEEMVEGSEDIGTACMGTFPITMKVVPEYLVWNDTQKDDPDQPEAVTIGNWNYDGNWRRATNGELKMSGASTDYPREGNTSGFVPMLFSKVILPRDSKVELYAAGLQKGDTDSRSWITHRPNNVAVPTDSIQYDLMAYTYEQATGSYEVGDIKTQPYRVSIVNQIHFEPGAEMLHAEYLLYDTAWVDYELTGSRWYTLASPLQGVVAGDFYTDNSTGKEGSEYFKDIVFKPSDNNRFKPSVYQRAWKGNATLVTAGNNTSGTSKEVAVAGNWSALYNDVTEAYTPGTGFSLKVQDLPTGSDKALFRLPKADPSYSYYYQDNTQPGGSVDITRYKPGRLRSDTLFTRNTNMTDAKEGGDIVVQLDNSYDGTYYLVGNPFMAHLDMKAFFDSPANAGISKTYWVVNKGNQWVGVGEGKGLVRTGDGTIAPLQSFFIKKDDSPGATTASSVTFTADMQVLGSGTEDGLRSSNALTITATTTDGRTSRAAVAYSGMASDDYQSGEDAELFLDSNLGDVPMVYTVAGTMASSINVRQNCELVPLGVYGARNEQVTLRFDQVGVFSGVKLYDTKTKRYTTLTDGSEVSVSTNDYGRYYLTGGIATGNEAIRSVDDISIYSVRSGEIVATSAGSSLRSVRVYGIGGELVTQQSLANQSVYRLRVPGNAIYVVYAEDMDGIIRNVKLRVR